MPIQKETSARLVKRNVTHDAISREVVQAITDPVALAIYTYLLTKPENWVVRKKEILDHFHPLGRDAYERAMRQLNGMGLAWVAKIKGEDGRFIGNEIVVEQTLDRDAGKPAFRENPNLGKSGPLKKKRVTTEEENGVRGWDSWVKFRSEIRKPITESAEKKQLELLRQYPPETQQQIIDRSITSSWQGLFHPKEKPNGQNQPGNGQGRKLSGAEKTRLAREQARLRQTGG